MAARQPQYYRPYLPSDDELSDADSAVSSWTPSPVPSPSPGTPTSQASEGTEPPELPDFAAFARGLAAASARPPVAGGPTFVNERQETAYDTNLLNRDLQYAPYGLSSVAGQLTTTGTDKATVVMLRSQDRDHEIFPQPTDCTLFLPRIYKNVKAFTIAQINLTSAFFYFRRDKQNLDILIYEKDRIVYNSNWASNTQFVPSSLSSVYLSTINGFPSSFDIYYTTPLKLLNSIREGSYTITSLLQELQTQLNKTPLFYDYLNGFADFLPLFQVNGDYSLNFNYPGDTYYDAVRKVFVNNPTRATITANYFQSQFANQFNYNLDQVRVAYYYPVLKEALLDPTYATSNLNLSNSTYSNQADLIQYLIYSFTGIDDPVATSVILSNISPLDNYRVQHTFRYSLVNRYLCSYDPANNRVSIQSATLNTSLVSLLNTQYSIYLTQQLNNAGLTPAEYNSLASLNTNTLSVLQSMYDYMQVKFATYFAINYGTYSRDYFANPNNTVLIADGADASGVATRYNINSPPTPRSNDLFNEFRNNPKYYWPALKELGPSNVLGVPDFNMGNPACNYPSSSNFPYSLSSSNMDRSRNFIDSSYFIYTDLRRRAGDILVNVEPMKYTVFRFRSNIRQTLQVESLPRQSALRYSLWNKETGPFGPGNPSYGRPLLYPLETLYDISYSWVLPSDPATLAKLYNSTNYTLTAIPGWSNAAGSPPIWQTAPGATVPSSMLGYASSLNFWSTLSTPYETITVANSNGKYYTFQTPQFSTVASTLTSISTNLTFATYGTSNTFTTEFVAFLYHETGAFLADVGQVLNRTASNLNPENPVHYKFSTLISHSTVSTTLTFTTFANQNYYLIFRPTTLTPNTTEYTITPWFSPLQSTIRMYSTSTNFDPLTDPEVLVANLNCNATQIADSNWIRFPIQSNLYAGTDPADALVNKSFYADPPYIGYDNNSTLRVSNDKTDYYPFFPYDNRGIDPAATVLLDVTNNYLFQCNSPYDFTLQTYFPPGTANALLRPGGAESYQWQTFNTAKQRQYKIVHWYSTHYIPDCNFQANLPTTWSTIISPNISSYNISSIPGVITPYFDIEGDLQLGQGVVGFTFIPGDGVYNMDRITFKANFLTSSFTSNTQIIKNPNEDIVMLGVYLTSEITTGDVGAISLSNALAVLTLQSKSYYSSVGSVVANLGGDANLGTFYTFSNRPSLVTRSNVSITGFTQTTSNYIGDTNNYFSVIAFSTMSTGYSTISKISDSALSTAISLDARGSNVFNVSPIHNLTGSLIPYPYSGSKPSLQTASANFPPTGNQWIAPTVPSAASTISNYAPPTFADYSMSVYERSIPIVNSHLHYVDKQTIINDVSGFSYWADIPTPNPTNLVATVPNFMLFQENDFYYTRYSSFTTVATDTNASRYFSPVGFIPLDLIFPSQEQTALLAVSGNTSNFVFLGASNDPAQPTKAQLRFKLYNPTLGVMEELPLNPYYRFDTNLLLQNFRIGDNLRWAISAKGTWSNYPDSIILTGDHCYTSTPTGSPATLNRQWTLSNTTSNWTNVEMDFASYDSSKYLYFTAFNSNIAPGFSNFYLYDFTTTPASNAQLPSTNGVLPPVSRGYLLRCCNAPGAPPYYQTLMTDRSGDFDEVFFLNRNLSPYQFFTITGILTGTGPNNSNATIRGSAQTFRNQDNSLVSPRKLFGGGSGSKWALFDTAPYVMGNRNDAFDAANAVGIAWQIFYPTIKIEMTRISTAVSAIIDRYNIPYPEWSHVQMFAYSNYSGLVKDIYGVGNSNSTWGKWGLESKSNFMVSDVSFSGYYFNSYVMNIPLNNNTTSPSEETDYYLAVRGYSPTEKFQTMLRFYLPNRYDFGFLKLSDLSGEAVYQQQPGVLSNFNPTYYIALSSFNSFFNFSNVNFGSNPNNNFSGSNLSSSNIGDFLKQYASTYSTFVENSVLLDTINSTIKGSVTNFIRHDLQFILPPSALSRQRFTDPLLFQILWKEQLSPNFTDLVDEWGLGWNLGYSKSNTVFGTNQTASSFFKIQQDFIYLRLSPQYNINGMDAGGPEDYAVTREPTGITNQYYCKLLLTSFGGNATTFIHNPIQFNPPLNRLTKLSFQWIDAKGLPITNLDAEWNMTVTITERLDVPSIPEKMPFTPADPKTGQPAPLPKGFEQPKAQEQGTRAAQREAEFLEAEQRNLRNAVLEKRREETSGVRRRS